MTILESLLLALALCADTLAVSAASGLRYREPRRRWLLLAFFLALFQGGFPLLGALLGVACEQFIQSIDHWIAFGLLLAVGGKMIFDAWRNGPEGRSAAPRLSIATMCLMGIATSIDAFAVGIGFGLSSTVVQSLVTCSIIFAVTFLVACLGIFLGSRGKHIPQRLSGTIAGLVLIALAVKALL